MTGKGDMLEDIPTILTVPFVGKIAMAVRYFRFVATSDNFRDNYFRFCCLHHRRMRLNMEFKNGEIYGRKPMKSLKVETRMVGL